MRVRLFFTLTSALLCIHLLFPWPVNAANWSGCVKNTDVVTIECAEVVFGNILGAILPLLGIAAFVMILYGGFQILIAGGDPKKTEVGQKTLTYAVFGLVAIFIAWFILVFISEVFMTNGSISDSPLFNFKLFFPD